MTDAASQLGDTIDDAPCSPQVVQDALRQIDRAIKGRQLHLTNNPSYLAALTGAREALAELWRHTDRLVLQVTDTDLLWFGTSVNSRPDKSGDALPWMFFKDGVREVTLLPGFEEGELERFLALIPRLRRANADEDDLLTMLWEEDFECLTYRHIELFDAPSGFGGMDGETGRWPTPSWGIERIDLAGGASIRTAHATGSGVAGGTSGAAGPADDDGDTGGGVAGGAAGAEAPRARSIIPGIDLDAAMVSLDGEDLAYLREETAREYALDVRRLVLQCLLDIFELQADPLVRDDVTAALDALVLHLLTAGHYATVAYLLREVDGALDRARALRPEDRERLGRLRDRLSEPEALAQMLQSLEESSHLPPKEELAQLFRELRPHALGPVLEWIDRTQRSELRPILEEAAERLATSHADALVTLIADPQPSIAREAIRRAGALRAPSAIPALEQLLAEGSDRSLRAAAVTALADIGTPAACVVLEIALTDEDRDVRLAAVRALTAKAFVPVVGTVRARVQGPSMRGVDRTERIAWFELYGMIAGDDGIPFLEALLHGSGGLFGRKLEEPEIRACAAIALGNIGSERSRAVLQRAAMDKDVIVRSAVNRALRIGSASA